jgi:uncharacterized sporulation protein YeaH/YhbH (DUF444 family)
MAPSVIAPLLQAMAARFEQVLDARHLNPDTRNGVLANIDITRTAAEMITRQAAKIRALEEDVRLLKAQARKAVAA